MWQRVSVDEWVNVQFKFPKSLFFLPGFLEDIANVYSLNTHFYIFKQKEQLLSAVSFFSFKNRVVTPVEFYYLPFWIDPNLSESVYFEVVGNLAHLLQTDYKTVYLKLSVDINDIRPFIWAGFKIENKYTHLKKERRGTHPSVIKNLRKLESQQYEFVVTKPDDESVKTNIQFLLSLGFAKSHCNKYKLLLNKWTDRGVLLAFNIYRGNKLICSNLVLLDQCGKRAYQILLDHAGKQDKYAHTVLYDKLFEWCFENGFDVVDTCGANLQNISVFKSYFGTRLTPYYKISYDPKYNFGEKVMRLLVKVTNKFCSVFG